MSHLQAAAVQKPDVNNDSTLSEVAQKLVNYTIAAHESRPTASLSYCMTIGMGKLVGEYGSEKSHVAQIAVTEIAAKWVFQKHPA